MISIARFNGSPIAGGGFFDMPADAYHADPCATPSLSSSLACTILAQTPRHARQEHPRLTVKPQDDATPQMDLGSVAHELLLGKGGGIAVLDFDNFRTKAAQQAREEAIAAHQTPILATQFAEAQKMVASVRAVMNETQDAEEAFDPDFGHSELVAIWQDIGGPMCRAMIDRVLFDELRSTATIYDLKTTSSGLSDRQIMAKIADGLDLRAAFYKRGIERLVPDMAGRVRFRWVFVETNEPFEARVIEMDAVTADLGDRKAAYAIEMWRRCLESDKWPGYPRKVERLTYPSWAEHSWLEREMIGDVAIGAVRNVQPVERKSSMIGTLA